MGTRLDFHTLLEGLEVGVSIYFQPPPNVQITYPAIVYNRDNLSAEFADNMPYAKKFRWQVTVIDADPDSPLHDKLSSMPLTRFVRHYTSEALNHDIYVVYF
jgi:hypothetical protein